jgi:hypothetical protein
MASFRAICAVDLALTFQLCQDRWFCFCIVIEVSCAAYGLKKRAGSKKTTGRWGRASSVVTLTSVDKLVLLR